MLWEIWLQFDFMFHTVSNNFRQFFNSSTYENLEPILFLGIWVLRKVSVYRTTYSSLFLVFRMVYDGMSISINLFIKNNNNTHIIERNTQTWKFVYWIKFYIRTRKFGDILFFIDECFTDGSINAILSQVERTRSNIRAN